MRRILVIFVFGATLVAASPAAARDLPLSPWTAFAVTDGAVYWVKQKPRGCRMCNQLWKLNIVNGTSRAVLPPISGPITNLRASGSRLIYNERKSVNGVFKTWVRQIDDGGEFETVAQGRYFPRRTRNCGTLVGAGAIAPSGEVAWQQIDVARGMGTCEYMPDSVTWSAFASHGSVSRRTIAAPQKGSSELLMFNEALDQVRPIRGFDGVHLLTAPDSQDVTLTNVDTGASVRYVPPGFDDHFGGSQLSPAGAVVTSFGSAERKTPVLALFKTPLNATSFVDLALVGESGSSVSFCGGELFQLAHFSRSIMLLHRSETGGIVSARSFSLGRGLAGVSLRCNRTTAVISYARLGKRGHILAERSFTVDLNSN